MFKPDIHSLELDITYACGFGCNNCNRMTVIAPGTREQNVTPEQVRHLLADSVECGYPWWRFSVLGGEPTVHPEFEEIMEILCSYRAVHNPGLHIRLSTHGHGPGVAHKLAWLREHHPEVEILNTQKTSPEQDDFDAINIAPQDLDPDWHASHQYEGCAIPSVCGIGFNYMGFYVCAIAGAIDRIFSLGLALSEVKELDAERLMATYNSVCSKCGHYRPLRENKTTLLSNSWRRALRQYQQGRP